MWGSLVGHSGSLSNVELQVSMCLYVLIMNRLCNSQNKKKTWRAKYLGHKCPKCGCMTEPRTDRHSLSLGTESWTQCSGALHMGTLLNALNHLYLRFGSILMVEYGCLFLTRTTMLSKKRGTALRMSWFIGRGLVTRTINSAVLVAGSQHHFGANRRTTPTPCCHRGHHDPCPVKSKLSLHTG